MKLWVYLKLSAGDEIWADARDDRQGMAGYRWPNGVLVAQDLWNVNEPSLANEHCTAVTGTGKLMDIHCEQERKGRVICAIPLVSIRNKLRANNCLKNELQPE